LAADGGREELLLLLARADGVDDRRRHVGLDHERHVEPGRAGADQLLGVDDVVPVVAAAAAELLGEREAEVAEVAHALEDLAREDLGALPLVGERAELLVDELAEALAEEVVVLGEEGHHRVYTMPEMAPTRILVVDDDAWILRMVTTVLEKRGYEVAIA